MSGRRRLALLVSIALLGAGCSRDDREQVPGPVAGARSGGTLKVALARPQSIDPGTVNDAAGRQIVRTMCDPLIQFDAVTGEPKPGVADSWQLADRGKKLTLRIRKGTKFSNGKTVTANDVLFTLSRLARADFASASSGLVAPVTGFAAVHGDEETDDDDLRRSLRGIKVVEGNSLEVELVTEFAPFLRALGHPAASPVSREEAEADPTGFERRPVCVGPYRLAEPWKSDASTIVLERSLAYEARNAGYTAGGRGYVDRIEFHLFADLDAQLAAYEAGEVDVAEIPPARWPEVEAARPDDVVEVAAPAIEYVGFPFADETFRDARVRRALSLALDRGSIAASAYGGARSPASGFLSPTLGRELYRPSACRSGVASGGGADLARARALLADAGVVLDGRKVTLAYNDELDNHRLVEAVAQQWRDAFQMDIELVPMAWQDYLSAGIGSQGFTGAFRLSWEPSHPDPDQYLAPLFGSEGIGQANFGHFSDPEFDRELRFSARRALVDRELVLEYRRLEDLACELMPTIPVLFDADQYLVRADRLAAGPGRKAFVSAGTIALRELFLAAGAS